ncbi:MAG: NAD(P)-dependent alcohol dehydrogenase [Sandaracinaceae bacterium]
MIQAYAAHEPGGALAPFEYDPGTLAPTDVEIEVTHCGICHSDLSMIDDAWEMSRYPLVPGHEVAGRVAAVGDSVHQLAVGDRVGLGWHAGYCNTCAWCLEGDQNLCADAAGTIVGRHGGFADRVRAQATSVVRLPDGLDLASAGPLFCGGITVFNPLVQFGIRPTDRVAVVGIGGLGHLALQFFRAWGCEVTAFTSTASKRDELLALGAHDTLNSRDPDALAGARGRFDLIVSTVNVSLDWNAYVRALRPRGRLHLVGASAEPLQLSVFPMLGGQRSVSASPVGAPATLARMLEFAVRHDIRPQVERYPMSEVNAAIQHLRDGKARYRVVLER